MFLRAWIVQDRVYHLDKRGWWILHISRLERCPNESFEALSQQLALKVGNRDLEGVWHTSELKP